MMENKIIIKGAIYGTGTGKFVLAKGNGDRLTSFNGVELSGNGLKCNTWSRKFAMIVKDPEIYKKYNVTYPKVLLEKPQKDKLEQAKRIINQYRELNIHLHSKCARLISEKEELLKEIMDLKEHNYVTYGCGGIAIIKGDHYVKVSECVTAMEEKEKELKAEFYDAIKKLTK